MNAFHSMIYFCCSSAWYHEEAACLSSQLVGLAIQGFQHWPQVGCVSRSSWVEIFCQAWKYKTGYLLLAPVRLYLCCLLEIIWEQIWIVFHVPIFRITPQLCKPHTTHNPLIRSDKGLELKTSFFDPFPELNLLFPTQIKKQTLKFSNRSEY